jgi:serine/threonine-protein kinase
MIGTQLDNYRVVEKLGDGGMGSVYRAIDVMLERDVALKFLRPELARQSDLVDRFRAEAVVLARLKHPNIAAIYGLHRHDGDLFMAMEYVPGRSLETLITGEGRVAPSRAAALAGTVLSALDYAHRHGVVHRDVKSANIIVMPDGDVKVMDFGIARVLGTQRQTQVGHVVGTLSYMSPEQIQGLDVDARSDLYSLGIVLYEMLTGRPPFEADTEWKLMQAQISQRPAALGEVAGVSADLETIVFKALEKPPDARFQNATEFRRALLAAAPPVIEPGESVLRTTAVPRMTPATSATAPTLASNDETVLHVVPALHAAPAQRAGPTRSMAAGEHAAESPRAEASSADTEPAEAGSAAPKPRATILATSASRNSGKRSIVGWLVPAAALFVLVAVAGWTVLWISGRAPSPGRGEPLTAAFLPLPPAAGGPDLSSRELQRLDAPTPEQVDVLVEATTRSMQASLAAPGAALTARPVGGVLNAPPGVIAPELPSLRRESPTAHGTVGTAPFLRFGKVRLATRDGSSTQESEVILQLDDSRLALFDKAGRTMLKAFDYEHITAASYSKTVHPGVFVFGRGTRHWFSVQTGDDAAVLRLDKSNQARILSEFQRLSGRGVKMDAADAPR